LVTERSVTSFGTESSVTYFGTESSVTYFGTERSVTYFGTESSVTYFGPAREEVRDDWKQKSPHKELGPIEIVIEKKS
jgi:hypothetical protein